MSKEQKIYTEIFKGIEAISDLQFENRKLALEKNLLEVKLKSELKYYKKINPFYDTLISLEKENRILVIENEKLESKVNKQDLLINQIKTELDFYKTSNEAIIKAIDDNNNDIDKVVALYKNCLEIYNLTKSVVNSFNK